MKRCLLSFAMLGMLVLTASATTLIDDFSDGDFDNSGTSGTIDNVGFRTNLSGVIKAVGDPNGGERDALFTFTKTNSPQGAELAVGGGEIGCFLDSGVNGHLELSYGSYTAYGPLDRDVSGNVGVDFDVTFADINLLFQITLESDTVEYFYPASATFAVIPGGGGATAFNIGFASFKDASNVSGIPFDSLQHIDGILFSFKGGASPAGDAWDLTVNALSFDAGGGDGGQIPEPATLSLLGLGVIALIRRRRKS